MMNRTASPKYVVLAAMESGRHVVVGSVNLDRVAGVKA